VYDAKKLLAEVAMVDEQNKARAKAPSAPQERR
jgi:hypothetical protein